MSLVLTTSIGVVTAAANAPETDPQLAASYGSSGVPLRSAQVTFGVRFCSRARTAVKLTLLSVAAVYRWKAHKAFRMNILCLVQRYGNYRKHRRKLNYSFVRRGYYNIVCLILCEARGKWVVKNATREGCGGDWPTQQQQQ